MRKSQAQRIKCRATSKRSGAPCQKWAVKGSLVCAMHGAGGKAETSPGKAKAVERVEDAEAQLRARLWELREDAVNAVREVLNDPLAKTQDKLRAADTVLNRFVAQKAETKVKVDNSEERDLDEEIASALGLEDPGEEAG